jgi:hypothetical protein
MLDGFFEEQIIRFDVVLRGKKILKLSHQKS